MTISRRTVVFGACVFGLSLSSTLQASVCDTYAGVGETALEGNTVCFVYNPAEVDPIFGTLQASPSSDNIFVVPTNFRAESTDGTNLSNNDGDGPVIGQTDNVSGTGTIQVIAKPGYVLDAIDVGEVGDYRMTAGGTSVDIDGWLRVFDWFDNVPVFGTEEFANLLVSGDLGIQDSNIHNWSASAGFDLTTAMWDGRDYVGLTLQNNLTAVSMAAGESAWIQKKAVGVQVSISTSVIPVPAAVWLFGSGLLGLAGIARNRKS